jgi:ABC-type ATPase involved in cell division
MIELEAVTKHFGRRGEVLALDAVDLVIRPGELVLITGASGSGKTTLLRILAALELPDAGTVRLFGRDVGRLRRSSLPMVRRKVGIALQDFRLLPERSALDNVGLALAVRGVARAEIRRRAADALAGVGLAWKLAAPVATLSTGEQQRVAIARAMIGQPEVLLLDEPTGNLDRATGRDLIEVARELHRTGTTVVVTTNDGDVVDTAERGPWRRLELDAGLLLEIDWPRASARGQTERNPTPNVVPFRKLASGGGTKE